MPTETQLPRLIDANAFIANLEKVEKEIRKGELPKQYLPGLLSCIAYAKSAPIVETTDDVLTRLPHGSDTEKWMLHAKGKTEIFYKGVYDLQDIGGDRIEVRGATPLEAVKKLEESINPK